MAGEDDLQNMSPEEIAKAQKENCIFCKIVKGEISSRKVYEDDKMLAILDINPATKGHTLVMPKEHYPILPIIPPETFKHLFRMTKHLSSAIKKGLVVGETTIFIANGAVAGQQSPHFLFHVIPNEGFDMEIPKGKASPEEVAKVTPPLRANMAAIMKQYLQREGKLAKVVTKEQKDEQPVQQSIQHPLLPEREEELPPAPEKEDVNDRAQEYSRDNLAKILMENPRLKEMIIHDPEKIKELIKTNKELARLFEGINIDRLSKKLQEFEKKDKKDGEKGSPTEEGNVDDNPDGGDESPDEPGHGNPEMDKIARLFS